MNLKDATFEALKRERPDLIEEIIEEEIERLKGENASMERDLARLERKELVAEKLKRARLPDVVVTELFEQQLRTATDERVINELIADRRTLLKAMKLSGPRSGERDLDRKVGQWTKRVFGGPARPTDLTPEELEEAARRLGLSIETVDSSTLAEAQRLLFGDSQ